MTTVDKENPYVCLSCGNRYLEENGYPKSDGVSTAHQGECCVCHKVTTVLHERGYKWLYKWSNEDTSKTKPR